MAGHGHKFANGLDRALSAEWIVVLALDIRFATRERDRETETLFEERVLEALHQLLLE